MVSKSELMRQKSDGLLELDEPANLSGIGNVPIHRPQRKAKRKRTSVLDDELSKLSDGDEESDRYTLANIYELAKMSSPSQQSSFFEDFWQIDGIQRVLRFLSNPGRTRGKQNLDDPDHMLVAANLTYLCIMRGTKAKDVSDGFVQSQGVEIFLGASAAFVFGGEGGNGGGNRRSDHRNENGSVQEEMENRYDAASAIWLALGMIFCKSGKLMKKHQHIAAIDAILETMDKLGDLTNKAREREQERNDNKNINSNNNNNNNAIEDKIHSIDPNVISSKAIQSATKTLHGVYRALNYIIDHVSISKEEVDSLRLFQRCHAVAKIPAKKSRIWESMTKSKIRVVPACYKNDDATLFLNTKIFFVSSFQKGLLQTRTHFEEAIPLCVETILRNSCKASKNHRAQDRRHCVFDLMAASCQKVHRTTLEQSGILRAIEATLRAEGTVKSSSKTKARELLKAIAALM